MLLVKTRLDVSPIHGIGLFADEFISAGTIIWKFNSVIDISLCEDQIEKLAPASGEQIKKYTYRSMLSGCYVLCGDTRFFNHSADPNCYDVCESEEQDLTIASPDIDLGEELTCDYALFDLDLVEGRYKI